MVACNLLSLLRQIVLREKKQSTPKTLRFKCFIPGAWITKHTRHKTLNIALIPSCLLRRTFVVSSSHSSTYLNVRLRRLLVVASVRLRMQLSITREKRAWWMVYLILRDQLRHLIRVLMHDLGLWMRIVKSHRDATSSIDLTFTRFDYTIT